MEVLLLHAVIFILLIVVALLVDRLFGPMIAAKVSALVLSAKMKLSSLLANIKAKFAVLLASIKSKL